MTELTPEKVAVIWADAREEVSRELPALRRRARGLPATIICWRCSRNFATNEWSHYWHSLYCRWKNGRKILTR